MSVTCQRRDFRASAVLALLWLVGAAAIAGGPTGLVHAVQPAASRTDAVLYDLQSDEALGGHTLARHVGKRDEELATRLRREPRLSAASTYSDVDTARRVVAAALEQSRAKIDAWASRSGVRPNLVVRYVQPGGRPVGRSLVRGAHEPTPCTRAIVVLRWHERQRRGYVLTSYPEARR